MAASGMTISDINRYHVLLSFKRIIKSNPEIFQNDKGVEYITFLLESSKIIKHHKANDSVRDWSKQCVELYRALCWTHGSHNEELIWKEFKEIAMGWNNALSFFQINQ